MERMHNLILIFILVLSMAAMAKAQLALCKNVFVMEESFNLTATCVNETTVLLTVELVFGPLTDNITQRVLATELLYKEFGVSAITRYVIPGDTEPTTAITLLPSSIGSLVLTTGEPETLSTSSPQPFSAALVSSTTPDSITATTGASTPPTNPGDTETTATILPSTSGSLAPTTGDPETSGEPETSSTSSPQPSSAALVPSTTPGSVTATTGAFIPSTVPDSQTSELTSSTVAENDTATAPSTIQSSTASPSDPTSSSAPATNAPVSTDNISLPPQTNPLIQTPTTAAAVPRSDGLSSGAVAGIVLGSLFGLLLIILGSVFLHRRLNSKKFSSYKMSEGGSENMYNISAYRPNDEENEA